MTLKEIDHQIQELKNQRYEIEMQEREEFKKKAVENVGRCFIVDGKYAKVIDIPQEEWDMSGHCHFNEYQYPAIFIGREYEDDLVPFYSDYLFSRAWSNGPYPIEKYQEITPEEFNAEFDRVLHNFRRKICGD